MKKQIIAGLLGVAALLLTTGTALAAITPPSPSLPTSTDQCKNDGWRDFGDTFKNQGDCVSFVVTEGRNEPDGPPNH